MTPTKLRIPILLSALTITLAASWNTANAAASDGPVIACPGPSLAPARTDIPNRESAPVSLRSNEFDAGDAKIAEARGHVELQRADQLLQTEVLLYDPATETVTMPGKVHYEDSLLHISGSSANYSFLTEGGRFTDANYGLTGSSANGSAAEVIIDSTNHSLLRQLKFTTCSGEKPEWVLTAKELELDFDTGVGTAIGTALGVAIGSYMDRKAKEEGRVI